MGRPKGENARSKSRPSSSSLAASLLSSGPAAAAAVGFGGFVGSSRLDLPSSSEDSLPFVDVDSEIAVHLKRLGRKDPTTKKQNLMSDNGTVMKTFFNRHFESLRSFPTFPQTAKIGWHLKALTALSVLLQQNSAKEIILIVPQWTEIDIVCTVLSFYGLCYDVGSFVNDIMTILEQEAAAKTA
ncbi:unnamed protein product [Sphenostylis stenocarpa]|uniref:E3 ubiquitin-protein ligase listerin n=1 Tax=Sphenostylis stenocarpa TaxID=92480 RepID=A0AA86VJM4_9FABA|nr:unnamed protein product [Sphenostylis stenocarpa]